MAQAPYENLFPLCSVELPGVPFPMLVSALNTAAQKLCAHAQCWREWQDVDIEVGEPLYDLFAPAGSARPQGVLNVLLNGGRLRSVTQSEAAQSDGNFLTTAGSPYAFWTSETGALRLYPIPVAGDAGKVAQVQASFIPTIAAVGCESRILDLYGDAISNGAKALLMRMPGKAWSSPDLSMLYEREFRAAVDKARIETFHDEVIHSSRVLPRRFGS